MNESIRIPKDTARFCAYLVVDAFLNLSKKGQQQEIYHFIGVLLDLGCEDVIDRMLKPNL